MEERVGKVRELGQVLAALFDGRAANVVAAAGGSAVSVSGACSSICLLAALWSLSAALDAFGERDALACV
jgi:hypothetical protein